MRLTVVCSRFPFPIEKGDKLRIYYQIRQFSRSYDIQLIALSFFPIEEKYKSELLKYCEEIHVFRIYKYRQYLNLLYHSTSSMPFQVAYFYDPFLKKEIQSTILNYNPDLIYCQLIRATEYIKAIPIPKVLDYMDAFSLNYKRRISEKSGVMKLLYKEEVKRLTQYERGIYYEFDGHTIISERDRAAIDIIEKSAIQIVKNGIDTRYFKPRKAQEEKVLIFVGNMGYEPNYIAAKYIIDTLLPELKKLHPTIKVVIAGARPPRELLRYKSESIIITGWIDDIRDAYMRGMILVAPIFTGSGLQNKILEAMAMKVPIVTTSIVTESIAAEKGIIHEANTAREFISGINSLLTDKERRHNMAIEGREYVCENFSWNARTDVLKLVLSETIRTG